jgi:hypothetical protein
MAGSVVEGRGHVAGITDAAWCGQVVVVYSYP